MNYLMSRTKKAIVQFSFTMNVLYYVSILKREENRVPGEKPLKHRRDQLWETMVRGIFPLSRYFPIISQTDELNYDSASPREISTVGSTKHTVNLGLSQ